MVNVLSAMGYCYGRRGQAGYQMQWHKCIGDSNLREVPRSPGAVDVNNYEGIARIMLEAAPKPSARLRGRFRFHGNMFMGEYFAVAGDGRSSASSSVAGRVSPC